MSPQQTSLDFINTTSSPASEDGHSPSATPTSNTCHSGPPPAHANHSAAQALAMGWMTSGTHGPPSTGSQASADLSYSLASRLQTLSSGGTLWRLTWNTWATPAGRVLPQQLASVRSTSASDSTGPLAAWGTPTAEQPGGTPDQVLKRKSTMACGESVTQLNHQVQMTHWPTSTATDGKRGKSQPIERQSERGRVPGIDLALAVTLTHWPTPTARDYKDRTSIRQRDGATSRVKSNRHDRITTLIPPPAQTGNTGSLHPAFPCWLLGYPAEWLSCGASAIASISRRPQRSSEQQQETEQ